MWRCPSLSPVGELIDDGSLEMIVTNSNDGWQVVLWWRQKGDTEQTTIGTGRIPQDSFALVRRFRRCGSAKNLLALCRADSLPRVRSVACEGGCVQNGRYKRRPKNGCNGQPSGQSLMQALEHRFILSIELNLCVSRDKTVSVCYAGLQSASPTRPSAAVG